MQTARAEACSTLLADGRLLVAGGIGAAGALNTAEMYGADGTFHSAGHMQTARVAAACVTLQDGRVLVSGGTDSAGKALTSAEIFDPSNNSWRNAGGMRNARSGHQMALTSWGSVIVAGGERSGSVEIYIPGEGSFQSIGRLSSVRLKGAIAALPGRRVAFLGGSNGAGVSTTIDIYDANSNTLKPGGTMLQGRSEFAAATLVDGRVWISGGRDSTGNTLSSTEIFDPAQGASTAGPDLPESRAGHSAYLLPHNNGVLLVGGRGESGPAASTLLYTSWNGNLTALPPMETARHQMTASPVGLGALVAAGGRNDGGILAGSELFRFPTIQPDRTLIQPGDTINFLGTGWKPGDRVALQVMALPADDRGVLFTGSGIVDRSGRLSTGGFTVPRGHSGGLQVIASGSGNQALDPMLPGDPTSITCTASPTEPPPPQYGNPVTFNCMVNNNGNPGDGPVDGGTVTVTYNSAAVTNGTASVASDGTFTFNFDGTTQYLPRGANTNLIGFQFNGFSPFLAMGSPALFSYNVAPRVINFAVMIGQPGAPNSPPPPGQETLITASTPQVNGAYPCGAVQLCITNVCSGPFETLSNGSYAFDLPGGLVNGSTASVQYQDTCHVPPYFVGNSNTTNYVYVFPTTTPLLFYSGTTQVTTISYGDDITFNANVTAADICTGTVQFSINGVPVGGPVTVTPGAVSGCTAVFDPGTLAVGVYTVTAAYSGDEFNNPSTGTNIFNVSPANTPPLGNGGDSRVQIFTAPSLYSGSFGSLGTGAMQFRTPCGLAINPTNSDIFLSDYGNSRIEMWSPTGQWIGAFGSIGTGNGQLLSPCGMVFGPNGLLYVADSGNNRVVIYRSTNPSQTAWSYAGSFGGVGTTAGKMLSPFGLTIPPNSSSSSFDVYVADTGNNRIEIFNNNGGYVGTFGSTGSGNGQLLTPTSLAFASSSQLLVVDLGNNRVEIFTSGGAYSNQFGNTGITAAILNNPFAIAVVPSTAPSPYAGLVMITDTGNNRVAVYNSGGAYQKQYGGFGTGHGQFEAPLGLAIMSTGYQVVSDAGPAPVTGCDRNNDCIVYGQKKN